MYMLADKGSMLTPPECELYYLTKMIIYDNNGSMVTDMSKYLYEEIYGKALHLYTSEKYGIDMDTMFDRLESSWRGIGTVHSFQM